MKNNNNKQVSWHSSPGWPPEWVSVDKGGWVS